ncbi:MAG TPA: glycosyltransferase family A protein [Planctomycetota bacterium]|nr:glycosyltransferase family A protein [Planctomycetota bacterium]
MKPPELPPAVAELLKADPPAGDWLGGTGEPGLVSVVITAFNSAELIGESLASILAQTYPRVETVVVDDGSSDRTREILGQWADRFRAERGWELRILEQPNRGQNSARNLGARASRGEFINFFDSDDLMAVDRLAAQAGLLQGGDLDLVYGPWIPFYEGAGGMFLGEQHCFECQGDDQLRAWIHGNPMIIWSCLLRRSFADRVGPFDERLTGGNVGSEHLVRLFLLRPKMAPCHTGPIFYRRHWGSVTFNLKPQAYANGVYWLTRLERLLAKRGDLAEYRKGLARKFRRYAVDAFRDGSPSIAKYCAFRARVHDPEFVPPRKLLRRLAFRLGGLQMALMVQGRTERLRWWRWRLAQAVGRMPRMEKTTWVPQLPLQPAQEG